MFAIKLPVIVARLPGAHLATVDWGAQDSHQLAGYNIWFLSLRLKQAPGSGFHSLMLSACCWFHHNSAVCTQQYVSWFPRLCSSFVCGSFPKMVAVRCAKIVVIWAQKEFWKKLNIWKFIKISNHDCHCKYINFSNKTMPATVLSVLAKNQSIFIE